MMKQHVFMFSSQSDFKILSYLPLIIDFINHIHHCIRIDYYHFYFDFLILTHFLFFSYLKICMIKMQ